MLSFEKSLFEEMMKNIDSTDKVLQEILNGKKLEEEKHSLVIFNKKVEEFLDLEGGKLGPFEKGQIANLPKEIAKILVEDGKAAIVEK
jgi:hypothetical protein